MAADPMMCSKATVPGPNEPPHLGAPAREAPEHALDPAEGAGFGPIRLPRSLAPSPKVRIPGPAGLLRAPARRRSGQRNQTGRRLKAAHPRSTRVADPGRHPSQLLRRRTRFDRFESKQLTGLRHADGRLVPSLGSTERPRTHLDVPDGSPDRSYSERLPLESASVESVGSGGGNGPPTRRTRGTARNGYPALQGTGDAGKRGARLAPACRKIRPCESDPHGPHLERPSFEKDGLRWNLFGGPSGGVVETDEGEQAQGSIEQRSGGNVGGGNGLGCGEKP